jgi:hypothetical protein
MDNDDHSTLGDSIQCTATLIQSTAISIQSTATRIQPPNRINPPSVRFLKPDRMILEMNGHQNPTDIASIEPAQQIRRSRCADFSSHSRYQRRFSQDLTGSSLVRSERNAVQKTHALPEFDPCPYRSQREWGAEKSRSGQIQYFNESAMPCLSGRLGVVPAIIFALAV